jgi:hypothetical protein
MGYKTRAIELRRFSKSKSEHLPKAQSQLSAGGVSAPYHKQRAMLHLPEVQSYTQRVRIVVSQCGKLRAKGNAAFAEGAIII